MEFFARVLWFVILIVLPIMSLRSCYLNLNLCNRQENIELLKPAIMEEMTKSFIDYLSFRERLFSQFYHAKLHQMCMEEAIFTGESDCSEQSGKLDIKKERMKFIQVLQQPNLTSRESLNFDVFYAEEFKNTHFFIDLYHEKMIFDFYQYIEKNDIKLISKNPDSIVNYDLEVILDHKVKQLFDNFFAEKFPFIIKNIESKGDFWDTLFRDKKECRAVVIINNKKYANPELSILYTSYQNSRGNTEVDPLYDYISYGVRVHELESPIVFNK